MPAIVRLYNRFLALLEMLEPALLFAVRLAIAHVFLASGLVKIEDFPNAVALFAQEYKVPLLPPHLAAVLSTMFELGCSVLLTLGLFARLATLPLLGMTAVIQFTYDSNVQHLYWALLLGVILFVGPGKWSLDRKLAPKLGVERA